MCRASVGEREKNTSVLLDLTVMYAAEVREDNRRCWAEEPKVMESCLRPAKSAVFHFPHEILIIAL